MTSNKEDRSNNPKSEGEKHQGVGVNPTKYKENKATAGSKKPDSNEPLRKSTGKA